MKFGELIECESGALEQQYSISFKERRNRCSVLSNRAQHTIEIAHSNVLRLGDFGGECNFQCQ